MCLNSKQFNKGGTIRYLIAVLLSVLLTILLVVPNKTTPAEKHIYTKPSTKTAKTVSSTKPDKAKVSKPVTKKPAVMAAQAEKPKPEVKPTYASGCQTYDSLFRRYDWNVNVAEAICMAESGGNPHSLSSTCDRGLMQINCVHSDMVTSLSSLYTPAINISVAWKIYSANGWRPWTTYRTGAYLKYL